MLGQSHYDLSSETGPLESITYASNDDTCHQVEPFPPGWGATMGLSVEAVALAQNLPGELALARRAL